MPVRVKNIPLLEVWGLPRLITFIAAIYGITLEEVSAGGVRVEARVDLKLDAVG